MQGVTIAAHDPREDTDEEITELVELNNVLRAELLPDDPPRSAASTIAAHRAQPPRLRRWSFRARDLDGALIGAGSCRIDPDHDDNPDLLEIDLGVRPTNRRNGVGSRILAALVDVAEAEGRTRLLGNVAGEGPGGPGFATAVGAERQYVERINHLPTAAVDRRVMEEWVAAGPERAPDYELLAFDGPWPEEHLHGLARLVTVLNDAPRDDLDLNDMTFSADHAREREAIMAAAGMEHWTLLARHVSGAYAGMHDVRWQPDDPAVVWVGLTAVDPAHRGHALGKWLKAAMTLRILDERPDVTDIRTGNADSNDAMLGINHAMGYRPLVAFGTWVVSTDRARQWLDAKGIAHGAGSPV